MNVTSLPNILDFDAEGLKAEFVKLGIQKYRAAQVMDWIYQKGVYDFAGMSNLPQELRTKLAALFRIGMGSVKCRSKSEGDESIKLLLEMPDTNVVEAVFIPKEHRRTVCISSQVGCKFHCAFCASGQAGFFRNLSSAEILAQVLRARDESKSGRVTNIVFMGIGEPLDNFDNVLKAVKAMNRPEFLNIGARKITISTCGVVPKIKALADLGMQIELAISLHGANDHVRGKLMPVNRRYGVAELLAACAEFTQKTNREVTFEYMLADGLNASPEDARELVAVLRGHGVRCKVNLIPLNPIPEFPYKRPSNNKIVAFQNVLLESGIPTTVRYSSGTDINAACGQLRSVEMRKAGAPLKGERIDDHA